MIQKYNHLIHEKSPYLLQHKDNPVHWYAWGEEAFAAAKAENKPIFLSVGYSTCHWCHVMEHDSFEKQEVADLLNEKFICIKVDREERPDVDEIYMAAVHAMGQRGGWPLSVFLTPDLKPFFGGTYWPQAQFMSILDKISKIWQEQPEKIANSGETILEHIKAQKSADFAKIELGKEVFHSFTQVSTSNFDSQWGGFGPAPKFPHTMQLSTLLRIYHRTRDPQTLQMITLTLEKMARGGMYDHLGGGFSRYSTDEKWLVPHFEKMLYDNALLAKIYLEAFQVTKEKMFAEVAREILDYVLREMTHTGGGFYSAEDADSEGEEGKFYVWEEQELRSLLTSEEFEFFSKVYGITSNGNFSAEGGHHANILSLQKNYDWSEKENPLLKSASKKLFEIREKRIHPHKDDKILTAWNGLMISAMALGYQVLEDKRYLKSAHQAAAFIRKNLYQNKKLLARHRDGEDRFAAYLDDYAYLIQGLIDLYECDFDSEILQWAVDLQNKQGELFWDKNKGAFFFTDGSDPGILVRSKEGMDGAIPNGNAVSALNLLRLFDLTLQPTYQKGAMTLFECFSKMMGEYPHAFGQMLIAYDYFSGSSKEIAILGKRNDSQAEEFLKQLRQNFWPNKVIAWDEEGKNFPALLKGKKSEGKKTTFYICQNQTCQKPTIDSTKALQEIQKY